MIGCVTVPEGPGYHVMPVRNVDAALVWQAFNVDLVRIVRFTHDGPHVSHYAPGLRRPIIRSCEVQ